MIDTDTESGWGLHTADKADDAPSIRCTTRPGGDHAPLVRFQTVERTSALWTFDATERALLAWLWRGGEKHGRHAVTRYAYETGTPLSKVQDSICLLRLCGLVPGGKEGEPEPYREMSPDERQRMHVVRAEGIAARRGECGGKAKRPNDRPWRDEDRAFRRRYVRDGAKTLAYAIANLRTAGTKRWEPAIQGWSKYGRAGA